MKNLLFIPFLFMCSMVIGQTMATKIIGKTIKIGKLEVAQFDFNRSKDAKSEYYVDDYLLNWNEAKKACADLGSGWRLPTKSELNLLYKNWDKIGGFSNAIYWSSSNYNSYDAWAQGFSSGEQALGEKTTSYRVRAVRSF